MTAAADFAIRHRALRRYILADEKIIVATRRHWAKLWEPILTTTGALVLAVTVLVSVDPDVRSDLGWLWLPFLALGGRLLYKWLAWRAEWFIMTDRRLLLLDGFLVHRVAMMPAEKVTDLGYERSPLGQLLGYGTFIFETAGQDQALDRVTWIPWPDARYRLIIAALFHPDAADAEMAAQSNPVTASQAAQGAAAAPTPPALPPAFTPRIGRRSNPPTQRIEIPVTREGAGPGGTSQEDTSSTFDAPTAADDAARDGTWQAHSSTVAPAASSSTTPAPRGRDSSGSEHVPGGPTAGMNAEVRPLPFIEGGKNPKIH